MIHDIQNKEDLEGHLKNGVDKLVVIDFFAVWCGPCQLISPRLEELAQLYSENIVILKVDVDNCEDIATEYNVLSMPTFVFYNNGERTETFSGANAEVLEKQLSKYLPCQRSSITQIESNKEESKKLSQEEAKRLSKEGAKRLSQEGAKRLSKEGAKRLSNEGAKRLSNEGVKKCPRDVKKLSEDEGISKL